MVQTSDMVDDVDGGGTTRRKGAWKALEPLLTPGGCSRKGGKVAATLGAGAEAQNQSKPERAACPK